MKLPNGERAFIDPRKLTEYALNHTHEDGKHKAYLFQNLLGITANNCDVLIEAIREAAAVGEAQVGHRDRYGQRYTVDFHFIGPIGQARLRSAWIVSPGEAIPRLVTCYIL